MFLLDIDDDDVCLLVGSFSGSLAAYLAVPVCRRFLRRKEEDRDHDDRLVATLRRREQESFCSKHCHCDYSNHSSVACAPLADLTHTCLFYPITLLTVRTTCSFNQAKPKTDVEARVYEVLSHKNWGSSSSLMHEVARDTFDVERFHVVTRLMWEGMENQRPAAWRVVFKALTLLEFLIKNGAERCVDDARNHGHTLRALGQFNYYEGTIDRGLGVREKTKQIVDILGDDERIREERQKAKQLRQKFGSSGATAAGGGGQYAGYGNQESWNAGNDGGGGGGRGGGGYGQGGIDSSSPYEGRYAGSRGGSGGPSSAAPTFASIPDNKPKKTKKKKKKPEAAPQPAAAPAPGTFFWLGF